MKLEFSFYGITCSPIMLQIPWDWGRGWLKLVLRAHNHSREIPGVQSITQHPSLSPASADLGSSGRWGMQFNSSHPLLLCKLLAQTLLQAHTFFPEV